METSIQHGLWRRRERQFKSYYVVWKPLWEGEKAIGVGKFKSYYVVWKRMHGSTTAKRVDDV